jgi:hypothetical protein
MITDKDAISALMHISDVKSGASGSSYITVQDIVSCASSWNRYAFEAIKRGDYKTAEACCVVVGEMLGDTVL